MDSTKKIVKNERKQSIVSYLCLLVTTLLVMPNAGVGTKAVVIQSRKNASTTTAAVTVVAASSRSSSKSKSYDVHPVVKSTCAATLYPDLCVSAIVNSPASTTSRSIPMTTPKDVILATLNQTMKNVQRSYNNITGITISTVLVLTDHEKLALQDCLVTLNDTLAELQKTTIDLIQYSSLSEMKKKKKNYSIQQIEEVNILISAAMTNQETCLGEFSLNKAEQEFRKKSLDGQLLYVFRSCSNLLAMVKNLTAVELDSTNRKVEEKQNRDDDGDGDSWPHWLTAGDRRLLQGGGGGTAVTNPPPDVTVAADGSANYRTVSEAVAAAPGGSRKRYIIKIKAGVYRENVEIPRSKTNLMFIGDGQKNTIITARRNVKEGSTTFRSATVGKVILYKLCLLD